MSVGDLWALICSWKVCPRTYFGRLTTRSGVLSMMLLHGSHLSLSLSLYVNYVLVISTCILKDKQCTMSLWTSCCI